MAQVEDSRSRVLSYLDREIGASLEDYLTAAAARRATADRAAAVVRALVPTAVAAALLSQEFPAASLDQGRHALHRDDLRVELFGSGRPDTRLDEPDAVGPVLVTDGESAEDLLGGGRRTRPRNRPGHIGHREG